jgi:hypothetical protein
VRRSSVPLLEQRFAILKKALVKPENKQKVIESYEQLCKVLESEADFIAKNGPSMVPEIDFDEVMKDGMSRLVMHPKDIINRVGRRQAPQRLHRPRPRPRLRDLAQRYPRKPSCSMGKRAD